MAVILVLLVMLVRPRTPEAEGALFALMGGLLAAIGGMSLLLIALAAAVATFVGAMGMIFGWAVVVAAAILIPTLVHVFAFTVMFVLTGATRGRTRAEWLPVAALALAAASFVVVPTIDLGNGRFLTLMTQSFAGTFAQLSIPGRGIERRLVGSVGFAYAYHYMNWFLKTGLLGWHRVSLRRLVFMAGTWIVVLFAYAENIVFGLLVSLPLSLGHVLLELPLNVMTARRLFSFSNLRSRFSAS